MLPQNPWDENAQQLSEPMPPEGYAGALGQDAYGRDQAYDQGYPGPGFAYSGFEAQPPQAWEGQYPMQEGYFGAPGEPGYGFAPPLHADQPPFEDPKIKAPPAYTGPIHMGGGFFPEDPNELPGNDLPDDRVIYTAPPRKNKLNFLIYLIPIAIMVVLLAIALPRLMSGSNNRTAIVTVSQGGSTYSGNALVFRNESVFQQEMVADIKYTAEEGEAVNRGDPVCTVYTSGLSDKDLSQLAEYRRQIKEYQQILLKAADAPDTKLQRLETTVLERAQETQALVRGAHGDLINQEALLKQAISERHQYLKQKYPDDTKLTRLYDNESNQLQRVETWTKLFTSTDNGIVSFYTDGLEDALAPKYYGSYTPQEVKDMLKGKVPSGHERLKNMNDIYRLVRQFDWGVLMLADDTGWNPVIGDSYQMLIESFDNRAITAIVESVTRSGNDLLVRFKVDAPVDPVLYIRDCRIQVSKNEISYAVPRTAVIDQNGVLGVVVQFAEGPYLVPVEVLSEDKTQAHVVPLNAGFLYEGLNVQINPKQR